MAATRTHLERSLAFAVAIAVLALVAFVPITSGARPQYFPKAGQKIEYSVSYEFKFTNGTIVHEPFFIEKYADNDYFISPILTGNSHAGIGNASKFTIEFTAIPNNATWVRATRYYTYRFLNGTEYVDPLPFITAGSSIQGPCAQSTQNRSEVELGPGIHNLVLYFIENDTYVVNDIVPGFANGTVIVANENETVVVGGTAYNITYNAAGLMKRRVLKIGQGDPVEYFIETLDLVAIINPRTGPPNGPAITGAAVPLILVAVLAVTIGVARRVRKNRE